MRHHKERNTDRNIHYDRLYHKIAEALSWISIVWKMKETLPGFVMKKTVRV
ncbi:MAG: hypothetical protein WA125_11880 [Desulfosporosinus sp.]